MYLDKTEVKFGLKSSCCDSQLSFYFTRAW